MLRVALSLFALLLVPSAYSADIKLDELVMLMKEGQGVEVHRQAEGEVLLSWEALPSRRISSKTVKIMQMLGGFVESNPDIFVHILLSADTDDKAGTDKLLRNLDYKAEKLRGSLLKRSAGAATMLSSGVVNQQAGNRVFLLVAPGYDADKPLQVALPVVKKAEAEQAAVTPAP